MVRSDKRSPSQLAAALTPSGKHLELTENCWPGQDQGAKVQKSKLGRSNGNNTTSHPGSGDSRDRVEKVSRATAGSLSDIRHSARCAVAHEAAVRILSCRWRVFAELKNLKPQGYAMQKIWKLLAKYKKLLRVMASSTVARPLPGWAGLQIFPAYVPHSQQQAGHKLSVQAITCL